MSSSRGGPRRFVIAVACTLAACSDSSSISVDEEREMGRVVAEQAVQEMPLLQDEPVVRFVRELGAYIVGRADTTGREYDFRAYEQWLNAG